MGVGLGFALGTPAGAEGEFEFCGLAVIFANSGLADLGVETTGDLTWTGSAGSGAFGGGTGTVLGLVGARAGIAGCGPRRTGGSGNGLAGGFMTSAACSCGFAGWARTTGGGAGVTTGD